MRREHRGEDAAERGADDDDEAELRHRIAKKDFEHLSGLLLAKTRIHRTLNDVEHQVETTKSTPIMRTYAWITG